VSAWFSAPSSGRRRQVEISIAHGCRTSGGGVRRDAVQRRGDRSVSRLISPIHELSPRPAADVKVGGSVEDDVEVSLGAYAARR
jgi:hypothetical protein